MPVEVHLATPSDDPAIRALLRRQEMPGRIRIRYEREPDFWPGCRVMGDDCQVLVARDRQRGEIAGVACRATRRVFVNGLEQRIGYLGQLRVDLRFRGRWLVSRGFRELRELHDRDPVPGYLAAIVDENPEAAGVLVRNRRRHFPEFHPVADYCTLAMGVRPAVPSQGETAGYGEIARFLQAHGPRRQFFPVWTEQGLRDLAPLGLRLEDFRIARRGGAIRGVAALWNQSEYKQTVIHGYSGWLKVAAPLYNLLRQPRLPRPGEKLRSAYAALIAVADDDPAVFRELLRELYSLAAARRFEYLLLGLDSRDPLLPAAREYPHVLYRSRLYAVEWPEGGRLYEQLDQRPVYVDIATL